ncbi:actin-related protein 2/3 complex subunit 5-B [Teleopsis dalmanni]|uniref:actin-related protein 2/3 complex subunit 5-B n=1 Tax=Teleopsis dalmanni TaxID=139649 RepID=UPI0018CE7820|nr:actin-related protein 2/3 complex subunit 5-B [Teleopsis dalmanni]
MAKNTSSSAFRKIDVDQYNEDNFKEDEADGVTTVVLGPDETEITTLLTQGKYVEALVAALQNAPLRCKQQHVKDHALNLTLRVLLSIKSSQMDQAVDTLEQHDLLDVLMKYIYRGFEIPSEGSSGHLLQWHEKAFAKGGVGCIVRVLSDTNRA